MIMFTTLNKRHCLLNMLQYMKQFFAKELSDKDNIYSAGLDSKTKYISINLIIICSF
jgi:hypothetical protein